MTHPPRIPLPRTPSERVLQVLAAGSVAVMLIFTASVWSRLPRTVPTHFGVAGPPDAWGDRSTLLLFPALVVLLYVGLSFLERFPHAYTYPIAITERNAHRLYVLGRQLVLALKVITIGSLGFVFHTSVKIALGEATGLSAWFVPASLGSVVVVFAIMALRMRRIRA